MFRRTTSSARVLVQLTSLLLTSLGLSACAANRYAGNMFAVAIVPPPSAEKPVYLIPDQVWQTYPDDFKPTVAPRELDQRLMEYKVEEDGQKKVDAIKYDVVIRKGSDLVVVKQITPERPGETFDVAAELRN